MEEHPHPPAEVPEQLQVRPSEHELVLAGVDARLEVRVDDVWAGEGWREGPVLAGTAVAALEGALGLCTAHIQGQT